MRGSAVPFQREGDRVARLRIRRQWARRLKPPMFRRLFQVEVIRSLLAHDAEVEQISPFDIGEDRLVGLLKTCAELLGNLKTHMDLHSRMRDLIARAPRTSFRKCAYSLTPGTSKAVATVSYAHRFDKGR